MAQKVVPFLILAFTCGATAGTEEAAQTQQQEICQSIEQLGHAEYQKREAAIARLVEIGHASLPALKEAREHPDPEIRTLAAQAYVMVRWRIGPKLRHRIGELMDDFAEQSPARQEETARDLGILGRSAAVPTLTEILKSTKNERIRLAAVRSLLLAGTAGLAALSELKIEVSGLQFDDVAVLISLGNSYLKQGLRLTESDRHERAEKYYQKALEQYDKVLKIDDCQPTAHYNIACTHSLRKKLDDAFKALEKSIDCGFQDFRWFQKDPDLDNLRDDPRYKKILERIDEERGKRKKAPSRIERVD